MLYLDKLTEIFSFGILKSTNMIPASGTLINFLQKFTIPA